ncbi:MAG TPA: hypothetical protein RMH99_17980, partial [Sandaracinaceae bacterium LLY-WYZ-13_1]|nr:hypothetical protein [Sandaracinaceae bacterium LLY-WYZ-13_1]
RLAQERGRLEEALEDFRRAHALAPSAAHLLALAEMLDALRRDAALIPVYRELLELAPAHPRAAEVRARLAILEGTARVPAAGGADAPAGAEVAVDDGDGASAEEDEEWDLFDEPWFWAVVAVVVGGGLVAALFLTSGEGVQDPVPGSDGGVIRTLVERP